MAYTEGSCADKFDLLGKIKLFLEDNGWTTDSYVYDSFIYYTYHTEQSTSAKRLHIHKNGRYLNFRTTNGGCIHQQNDNERWGIGFNISTGYNSSKNWNSQPGVQTQIDNGYSLSAYTWMQAAASYKMFLWDDPFTFFVFLKYSETFFNQIYFGEIASKYGSWEGGDLFLGTTPLNDTSNATKTSESYSFLKYDASNSYQFRGAINISESGIIPSGNTWAGSGCAQSASTDSLFVPYLGVAYSWGSSGARSNSLLSTYMDSALQPLPSGITSPIQLYPIQPALRRNISYNNISLLGELPYMRMTAGPISLAEQVFAYAGTKYMLLPLGTPADNSTGCYVNPLLAVEYEGA